MAQLHRTSLILDSQMIDIQRPSYAELHPPQHHRPDNHDLDDTARDKAGDEADIDQEAEEAAWLESVQAAGLEQVHLPQEPLSTPISVLREPAHPGKAESGR